MWITSPAHPRAPDDWNLGLFLFFESQPIKAVFKKTKNKVVYTDPQSRTGGQGQYIEYTIDRLTNRQTDRPMDRPTQKAWDSYSIKAWGFIYPCKSLGDKKGTVYMFTTCDTKVINFDFPYFTCIWQWPNNHHQMISFTSKDEKREKIQENPGEHFSER